MNHVITFTTANSTYVLANRDGYPDVGYLICLAGSYPGETVELDRDEMAQATETARVGDRCEIHRIYEVTGREAVFFRSTEITATLGSEGPAFAKRDRLGSGVERG